MEKLPLLLINAILILLIVGSAEAITATMCSPQMTATYYIVPSTVNKSVCVKNDNAYPATITLSASDPIAPMIQFSQTTFVLAVGEQRWVPFNISVTDSWDHSGTINANFYVPQDGFPNYMGTATLAIKKGTIACTDGQTQLCNTTESFPGTQNCTNYQWGRCVKIDTGCTENWNCTNWNPCQPSGTQTRICTDLNSCGTTFSAPGVIQSCVFSENTSQCAILSPANNSISNLRNQYFAVNCSYPQAELRYSLNRGASTAMCRNCSRYNISISFMEGTNNLTLMANNSWNVQGNQTNSFLVDSIFPAFWKSVPTGSYLSNGTFTINYTEQNPKKTTFYYREVGKTYQSLERTDCPGGNYQACSFILDLAPFDGKNLEYMFSMVDLAGNTKNYTSYRLMVYVSKPVLTITVPFKPTYNASSAPFNLSVTKNVTLKYRDFAQAGASNISLCTACSSYNKPVPLSQGFHNITIYAVDPAGNMDQESASFFVDYTKPQISAVLPTAGFVTGIFNLTYTEANCVQINLSVFNATSRKEMAMPCVSGTYLKTFTAMNLSVFEGQTINYTFKITDVAGNTGLAGANNLIVDTIPPVFTKADTKVVGKYLYWNVTLDSGVRYLRYIDYKAITPYENLLCTNCGSYGNTFIKLSCDFGNATVRYTYFATSAHNVSLIAEDYAGNRARKDNILFTII